MSLVPHESVGRRGPVPTLAELAEMLRDPDLAAALRDSVTAWPGRTPSRRTGPQLGRLVLAALDAVGRDLECNPRTPLLEQLIRDDRDLGDEEIAAALELIYSHMVNRFQGDLAEILAIGTCSDHLATLGATRFARGAELVMGIECPRLASSAMANGPDALLAANGDDHLAAGGAGGTGAKPASGDLVLYGVVEVKSYLLSVASAEGQLRAHRRRLERGVRWGGRSWSGDRLWFHGVGPNGPATVTSGRSDEIELVELLVVPALRRPGRSRSTSSNAVRLHLPFDRERLMSAAYCMTEWFASILGERVFSERGSPWSETTPAQAGFNRIKEALYHIQLRDFTGLKEHATDPAGWRRRARRLDRIATRLYNAYGWGLSEALQHKGLMWSIQGRDAG